MRSILYEAVQQSSDKEPYETSKTNQAYNYIKTNVLPNEISFQGKWTY